MACAPRTRAVIWLAVVAGVGTAQADSPRLLCRRRGRQHAAGNMDVTEQHSWAATRLAYAQVRLWLALFDSVIWPVCSMVGVGTGTQFSTN